MNAQVVALHAFDSGVGFVNEELALVFLHYFGGSGRAWCEVMEQLKEFRCIAPDLRGFGDSHTNLEAFSVDDLADDVVALLERLNVARFVLIGHSMGGKIALALAARQLSGLEALVLLAPSPPSPEPMSDEIRQSLREGFGKCAAASALIDEITVRPLCESVRARTIDDNLRSSLPAWTAWLDAGSREDISASMPLVDVPVWVVAGAGDAGLPARVLATEVVARLSDVSITEIAGAGHLLPLEAPVEVAALIRGSFHPAG